MTPNKRIVLNIVATYGRSLYSLVIGLFAGRWVLMALGKTDFGLVGLIGGLTAFITFLNNLLASAVGRFYAVQVGASRKVIDPSEGIDECRKWFNTALSIHTVVPIVLMLVGYPIGSWAIENFLEIPTGRIIDCIWVWRFACASCLVAMFNVPFQAMYTAKQEIAELTIYSFATTTLNAIFVCYMASHPGYWLFKYSAWVCIIGIAPQILIAIRALMRYPECHIICAYLFSRDRYRSLFKFVTAQFWTNVAILLTSQGRAILVNKFMGATFNASMSVGNTVASQALTLSSSLSGAFWPAINNKAGERDLQGVRKLSFMTMRLSSVLVLFFAIPLAIEAKEILRIWLVTPPEFTVEICQAVLLGAILDRMTNAYATAIYGIGVGVMRYSWVVGWGDIAIVALTWCLFVLGFNMWSIVIGLIASKVLAMVIRLYYGWKYIQFSFSEWLHSVFLPIGMLILLGGLFGVLPHLILGPSLKRILITTFMSEIVLLFASWFLLLDASEKNYILHISRKVISK